jgi:hypothetical protein
MELKQEWRQQDELCSAIDIALKNVKSSFQIRLLPLWRSNPCLIVRVFILGQITSSQIPDQIVALST